MKWAVDTLKAHYMQESSQIWQNYINADKYRYRNNQEMCRWQTENTLYAIYK